MIVVALTIVFIVFGINPITRLITFLSLLGLVLVYTLFWFALAFLVNLWAGSSAKNAVALIGLWVVFVLLVPSVLNQLGNTLYPMPSRTLMINEMRSLKAAVTEKQDEILDNYLRDHPEYAINDTTQKRSFYHRYMASQNLIKVEMEPVVQAYEEQLNNQQAWIGRLKWISPSIALQESLNQMAGTSTRDYESFREQVVGFAGNWREHFMPFLYNNRVFTQQDHPDLPSFQYKHSEYSYSGVVLVLFALSIILFCLGFLISTRLLREGLLGTN